MEHITFDMLCDITMLKCTGEMIKIYKKELAYNYCIQSFVNMLSKSSGTEKHYKRLIKHNFN